MALRTIREVGSIRSAQLALDIRHPDFPLTQFLRAARGFLVPGEDEEVARALRDKAAASTLVESRPDGVLVYGREETALKRAVESLAGFRWRHLVAQAVGVRACGEPPRIPWMQVSLRGPRRFAVLLQAEFHRRGGQSRGGAYSGESVMLSGLAPMTQLLGLAEWVAHRTEGKGEVTMRLDGWRLEEQDPHPPGPMAA